MQAVASVTREELENEPDARLWALITYIAENLEARARGELRPFWLAYVYDAEVGNGGHLQYFHNQGSAQVEATLAALRAIGAQEQAALLQACAATLADAPIEKVSSLQEYAEMAQEELFSDADAAYYEIAPGVMDLFEAHYAQMLERVIQVDG